MNDVFDADLLGMSSPELVRMLGRRMRDYRMRSHLTQQDMAERTGVSKVTVHKFETGQVDNVSLVTFLQLLRAVGRLNELDALLPELPPSLYQQTPTGEMKQRIRHTKR